MVSVGTGRPGNAEWCSLWEEDVCESQDTWIYVQRDLKGPAMGHGWSWSGQSSTCTAAAVPRDAGIPWA